MSSFVRKLLFANCLGPLQILICLIQIYLIVGLSMLAGLGVLLVCVPVNFWASKRGEEYVDTQLAAKDKRIKLMNEILAGIKASLFTTFPK
jgi:Zn-dependent membrane protease YugP